LVYKSFSMKEIRTEIEIEASAERVWQIITYFATFSEWNTFIRRTSGGGQDRMEHDLKYK
jgi:uncharacterized protein YndB with AHSA1/START domain